MRRFLLVSVLSVPLVAASAADPAKSPASKPVEVRSSASAAIKPKATLPSESKSPAGKASAADLARNGSLGAAAPEQLDAARQFGKIGAKETNPLGTDGRLKLGDPSSIFGAFRSETAKGGASWLKPSGSGDSNYDPSGILPNGGRNNRTDRFSSSSGHLAPKTPGEIRGGFANDGPAVGQPGDSRTRHESRSDGWTGTSGRSTSSDGHTVTVEVTMRGTNGGTEYYREVRSDGDKDGYAETIESRVVEYTTSDGKSNRQETTRQDDGQYVTDTVRITPGQAPETSHTTTSEPPAAQPLGHIRTGAGAGAGSVDPYESRGSGDAAIPGQKAKAPKVVEAVQSGLGKKVRPDDSAAGGASVPRLGSNTFGNVVNPGTVDMARSSGAGPLGARALDQGKLVNPGRDPKAQQLPK